LVIALADLLEAEGRALRKSVVRVGGGIACLGVAMILAVFGVGLCLWAVYLWLVTSLGSAGAAAVIGGVLLCLAGGLTWVAIALSR
jgi:hypothetical protein